MSVFVAADRKCLDQAMAIKGEGIEPRKAFTQLVQYGCGFLVPSGVAVQIDATDGNRTKITLLGWPPEHLNEELMRYEGKSGWVLTAWVRKATQ
jgi:hypothetical protein